MGIVTLLLRILVKHYIIINISWQVMEKIGNDTARGYMKVTCLRFRR